MEEVGREVLSGRRPLGVKSDPGKRNLFPAAPPSDSGQREGGDGEERRGN